MMCKDNDISLCSWVQGVLSTSHVVCCVIDTDDLVTVDSVVDNSDFGSFMIGVYRAATGVLWDGCDGYLCPETVKEVVQQVGNKVLSVFA